VRASRVPSVPRKPCKSATRPCASTRSIFARSNSVLRVKFVTFVGNTRVDETASVGLMRLNSASSSAWSGSTSSRFASPSRMVRMPCSRSTLAHASRVSSERQSPASAAVRYHPRRPRLSATSRSCVSSTSDSGRRTLRRSRCSSIFESKSSGCEFSRLLLRHQFPNARKVSRLVSPCAQRFPPLGTKPTHARRSLASGRRDESHQTAASTTGGGAPCTPPCARRAPSHGNAPDSRQRAAPSAFAPPRRCRPVYHR